MFRSNKHSERLRHCVSTHARTVAGTTRKVDGTDGRTTGNVRVDVAVPQSDGPSVAAMAAAGRIALVVTTRD
jgi:hypothetical protein